jgi:hypothetical protein
MKTITEVIAKPSSIPTKKNGGMVTLFHPGTEEIRDFWPIDAKEARQNGWVTKPERAFLVEAPKEVVNPPGVPSAGPSAPSPSDVAGTEETVGSGARRSRRTNLPSSESSDESK